MKGIGILKGPLKSQTAPNQQLTIRWILLGVCNWPAKLRDEGPEYPTNIYVSSDSKCCAIWFDIRLWKPPKMCPIQEISSVSTTIGIYTRWWFQIFFDFHPEPWGNDPIWLISMLQMGWWKTTNSNNNLHLFFGTLPKCNIKVTFPIGK